MSGGSAWGVALAFWANASITAQTAADNNATFFGGTMFVFMLVRYYGMRKAKFPEWRGRILDERVMNYLAGDDGDRVSQHEDREAGMRRTFIRKQPNVVP